MNVARRTLLTIFLLIAALIVVQAEQPVREISWEDLLPKESENFDDPFTALSEEQLADLGMIVRIRYLLENNKIQPNGPDAKQEKELVKKLTSDGIKVDWILSQRERVMKMRQKQAEAVDTSVDGKNIRIPGYMLPLNREENGVSEFLLVPWVGACIHTPPPPPNQMVHVRVPNGTKDRGRFAAIWIEGVIELEPRSYDLFLIDGSRSVKVAYTMTTGAISRYSSRESDILARVEVPEDLTAKHSWWQRWNTEVSLLFTKAMTSIRDRESSGPLFLGLLVAFLYGIIHTLGPGHGKAVVMAYFVGERGSLGRGIRMGSQIALFHVLSAVLVVVLTDFAIRKVTGSAPSDYRTIRLVSYAAIVAIGGWMLFTAIRSVRNHHHHHHHEGCGCGHLAEPSKGVYTYLTVAVGAVPCTGALLVLLFGLANDLLWPSILLTMAISVGMAVALSAVGIAAILGRRFVDKRVGEDGERQQRIAAGIRIGAALVIVLIGCALFSLTWKERAKGQGREGQRGDLSSLAETHVTGGLIEHRNREPWFSGIEEAG